MKKGDNGVWEVVLGPLDPGAYRYSFMVDGVTVVDPRNSAISESNEQRVEPGGSAGFGLL